MGTKGKRMVENNSKSEKTKKEQKGIGKKIAIIIVTIILIFAIVFGILVFIASTVFGKIGYGKLDESQLGLNDNLYEELSKEISKDEFDNIKNVALFGVDGGRSDTIMIVSINQTDHTIKLISIPRDTYVSVDGYGKTKINHAYAYGKEQLALKTINSNFGLNISEYVTINFKGLINIINKLGRNRIRNNQS